MKLALVIQPATIASGGGQILRLVGQALAERHEVDLLYLTPSRAAGAGADLRTLKSWVKITRAMWHGERTARAVSTHQLDGYDRIFAGWVGDVAQLLAGGIAPDRIVHICQSVETWAGDTASAALAYGVPLERWFVADWLADSLAATTVCPQFIGNAINDLFFQTPPAPKESARDHVTYLTHPGWWKNVTECAVVAETIAARAGLRLQTFGTSPTGREHVSLVRPDARGVLGCLDRTRFFVTMSFYEGMPLVAMEALARGCFLVLSDIPAHREIWRHVGDRHCRLLRSPPIHVSELHGVDWAATHLTSSPPPQHLASFTISSFQARVRSAVSRSLG